MTEENICCYWNIFTKSNENPSPYNVRILLSNSIISYELWKIIVMLPSLSGPSNNYFFLICGIIFFAPSLESGTQ